MPYTRIWQNYILVKVSPCPTNHIYQKHMFCILCHAIITHAIITNAITSYCTIMIIQFTNVNAYLNGFFLIILNSDDPKTEY